MLKQNVEEGSGTWNIEFRVLMYTQLAVINSQRLCDFDTVALKNGPRIRKCRLAECMACIWEAKTIRYSGNPGIRGGFNMQNPVFITWLHLSMLIDIHTPRVPLNKSFYHKTIQLTKKSMQTIATTNPLPLGGTLKEPMIYLRRITFADGRSLVNARLFHLSCDIAALRENPDSYICINPRY